MLYFCLGFHKQPFIRGYIEEKHLFLLFLIVIGATKHF